MSDVSDFGTHFTIRRMVNSEVSLALDWAAAEGWNPGKNDAQCFHSADPDGFLIGEWEGEPVACISAVAYDDSFGFVGLYIVKPEFRGKGLGIRIWQAGMAYLGNRCVGLDGVVTQQANYKKSGFRLAYRNVRYQGTGKVINTSGVVALSEVSFDQLATYDALVFPARRPEFLRRWIRQPEGAAFGVLRDGQLAGYGVLRQCRDGFKIGPLFADDETIAETLFGALVSSVPGKPVFLDIPEINPRAIALAKHHGMEPAFETARMYTKEPPGFRLDSQFGVTTFEVG